MDFKATTGRYFFRFEFFFHFQIIRDFFFLSFILVSDQKEESVQARREGRFLFLDQDVRYLEPLAANVVDVTPTRGREKKREKILKGGHCTRTLFFYFLANNSLPVVNQRERHDASIKTACVAWNVVVSFFFLLGNS